jgi:hypothetical protein
VKCRGYRPYVRHEPYVPHNSRKVQDARGRLTDGPSTKTAVIADAPYGTESRLSIPSPVTFFLQCSPRLPGRLTVIYDGSCCICWIQPANMVARTGVLSSAAQCATTMRAASRPYFELGRKVRRIATSVFWNGGYGLVRIPFRGTWIRFRGPGISIRREDWHVSCNSGLGRMRPRRFRGDGTDESTTGEWFK